MTRNVALHDLKPIQFITLEVDKSSLPGSNIGDMVRNDLTEPGRLVFESSDELTSKISSIKS